MQTRKILCESAVFFEYHDSTMTVEKRKLTVKDFLLMSELGVFRPDEHVELLDGRFILRRHRVPNT